MLSILVARTFCGLYMTRIPLRHMTVVGGFVGVCGVTDGRVQPEVAWPSNEGDRARVKHEVDEKGSSSEEDLHAVSICDGTYAK